MQRETANITCQGCGTSTCIAVYHQDENFDDWHVLSLSIELASRTPSPHIVHTRSIPEMENKPFVLIWDWNERIDTRCKQCFEDIGGFKYYANLCKARAVIRQHKE